LLADEVDCEWIRTDGGCRAGLVSLMPEILVDGPSTSLLAAVRTAVLAGMAVVLAGLGGRRSWPELRWLVYATLAAGAVKLLVEDLGQGRPITLFVAFALYGGALVAVPRLMRSE